MTRGVLAATGPPGLGVSQLALVPRCGKQDRLSVRPHGGTARSAARVEALVNAWSRGWCIQRTRHDVAARAVSLHGRHRMSPELGWLTPGRPDTARVEPHLKAVALGPNQCDHTRSTPRFRSARQHFEATAFRIWYPQWVGAANYAEPHVPSPSCIRSVGRAQTCQDGGEGADTSKRAGLWVIMGSSPTQRGPNEYPLLLSPYLPAELRALLPIDWLLPTC